MYLCPICNQPGIPVWYKLCLGPAFPARCKQCGKKVGLPSYTMLTTITTVIPLALYLVDFIEFQPFLLLTVFIGIILSIIYLKWIPLIPKE